MPRDSGAVTSVPSSHARERCCNVLSLLSFSVRTIAALAPRIGSRALALLASVPAAAAVVCAGCVAGAAAPEPFCPGGTEPSANVIFCEDFEDRSSRNQWNVGSNRNLWPISDFVLCTDRSFGFDDACAAWSNRLVFDSAWGFYGYDARRSFPPQAEFYIRWYQYISDPYTWGTLENKSVLLMDRDEKLIAYVGTNRNHLPTERNSGPGMPFVANYQDVDWRETAGEYTRVNRFQNQGENLTLQPGKWYLFEWHVKLNTPGVSDGITRLWIDEAGGLAREQTLRMQHTDMRWLRRDDVGKQFGVLRLTVYHQRCDGVPNTCPPNGPVVLDQSHRWDQIVVSKARIGPIAHSRPPTLTGLRIVRQDGRS
jgi:hypothetical protein